MATHWLREVRMITGANRAGVGFYSKMLCFWLYNVIGYTNFSESVTPVGSDTYDPTAGFTGNNASFNASGTDYNLVDATYGAFAGGDVGKWILISSPAVGEEMNSGWYRITAVPDANTATLDFRCGAGEYPIQHAGTDLEWWMLAEDENTPDTVGDYWILQTPHADAWEIEVTLNGYELRFRMSLNADWTATGKILQGAGASSNKCYGFASSSTDTNHYHYAEADSYGTFLNIWRFTDPFASATGNNALCIGKITPIETTPAHTDPELWVILGPLGPSGYNVNIIVRGTANMTGWVWREKDSSVNLCYNLEWTYDTNSANSFTQWSSNEANARTGKTDIKSNIGPFVIDRYNAQNKFEIMGNYTGLYECRDNLSRLQTIDDAGTKDKLHLYEGYVVTWPGITPQI